MADARKKAHRKGSDGGAGPSGPQEPPTTAAPPEPASSSAESWTAGDEGLVFPAEASDARAVKITLPSSGTAEEILAREDAAALVASPVPTALSPVAPPGAAAEAAPARAHNISFFAAPTREERKAVEATEHLATFFLAGEEYGVDVRLVQEIIRVTEITQLPRAPDFIKGVINLRGRIIPVLDLKRKLSLGSVELTRQARIVVVKIRERLVGLLVDGASQVLKVPVSSIEAAPEEVGETEAGYIRGVAKQQSRLIILVDLYKFLAPELREGAGAPGGA
jgi:purine-binding chemotaxis protein CheW